MLATKITNKDFLTKTIKDLKQCNPAVDIQLLEKTLGALFLVESLANTNLNFIFKGGTSLILLLNELKRFSIDVDIITDESKKNIANVLEKVINNQTLFTRVEENIRYNDVSNRMEIEHYKFYFNSVIDNSEKYILLDIAHESNLYPTIINSKIQSKALSVNSDSYVKIPSIESILGDKLTVLAPNTTGIHYNSKKELELIKQLYDVDKLFNHTKNITEVKMSFIKIANREIKYRNLQNTTYIDVLIDIENFAKEIIFRQNKENLNIITTGIHKFSNYMLESKFLIDKEALTAASKILYLVQVIKTDGKNIEKYPENNINNIAIPIEYKKRLNVIKKINYEAYYYIVKAILL